MRILSVDGCSVVTIPRPSGGLIKGPRARSFGVEGVPSGDEGIARRDRLLALGAHSATRLYGVRRRRTQFLEDQPDRADAGRWQFADGGDTGSSEFRVQSLFELTTASPIRYKPCLASSDTGSSAARVTSPSAICELASSSSPS